MNEPINTQTRINRGIIWLPYSQRNTL